MANVCMLQNCFCPNYLSAVQLICFRWGIIVGISALGMLGYFTYVASLNFVSATTCTVAGTFEIVLAYGVQVRSNTSS